MNPEYKKKNEFKYYNNTYIYVSFRDDFIPADDTPMKTLYKTVVIDELRKDHPEYERHSTNIEKVRLRKVFSKHMMISVEKVEDLKPIARVLSKRKEILAVEFLQRQRFFGEKASLDEMNAFKSKVRK